MEDVTSLTRIAAAFWLKRNIYLHMQIDPRYQNDVNICLEDSIQKLIK